MNIAIDNSPGRDNRGHFPILVRSYYVPNREDAWLNSVYEIPTLAAYEIEVETVILHKLNNLGEGFVRATILGNRFVGFVIYNNPTVFEGLYSHPGGDSIEFLEMVHMSLVCGRKL